MNYSAYASTAVLIGNPSKNQYPHNNVGDCYARSVWDLQYYDGRIYVASGDFYRVHNKVTYPTVAVKLWSFGTAADFTAHFSVRSEMISKFHHFDDKLVVIPKDNIGADVGHLVIRDGAEWKNNWGCIPDQNKGRDTAIFNNRVYVLKSARSLRDIKYEFLESSDMGQTWDVLMYDLVGKYNVSFTTMMPLDDSLLIFGTSNSKSCVFKYNDDGLQTLLIPDPSPAGSYSMLAMVTERYKDGVLYSWGSKRDYWSEKTPLYFLNDFVNGAVSIEFFEGKMVRDFIVRGDTAYVLTAELAAGEDKTETICEWQGSIYSSNDLTSWTKTEEFLVPGLPHSLEEMDGKFYVGLGNRVTGNYYGGPFADVASGNIYRIDGIANEPPTVNISNRSRVSEPF